jgi:hypothetical protein
VELGVGVGLGVALVVGVGRGGLAATPLGATVT